MLNKLLPISIDPHSALFFKIFSLVILLSVTASVMMEEYVLLGIPAFLLLVFITVVDFRKTFYILLACIPISTEVVLPNGFGTDLPTEPLIVGLMLVFVLYLFRHGTSISKAFITHPITLLLMLHLSWTLIATIASEDQFVSLKFFLAKIWYVATFYFLAAVLLKEEKDIKSLFWWIVIPLFATISVIMVRHAGKGFSFEEVHFILGPFYRNHVAYASIMSLFFPFIWFARKWYKPWSGKWLFIVGGIVYLFIAIQLSFTRAATVSIFLAAGTWLIIHFRLMKLALVAAVLIAAFFINDLSTDNKYLYFAPDFEKTITHKQFDNLIEATYNMEDISTMERVYRWIAGFYMFAENPWMGFGPGNFHNFYKSYTVSSFKTYVSDNPEKSGIHSYYLMVLVEQGTIGAIFYFLLVFYFLIKGEQIYHQTKDPRRRDIVLMVVLCMVIIDALLLINDMIETDKVGPFFFICMAVLVNMDLKNRSEIIRDEKNLI